MTLHTNRRRLLGATGALALSPWSLAQEPSSSNGNTQVFTIAQVVDTSIAQQDVSKDLMIGSRAAWQEINSNGGLRGLQIRHATFEVDGSPQSLQEALQAMSTDRQCIAISATSGERAAVELVTQMRKKNLGMAHVAPWLQNSTLEVDNRTFPIFAARQQQIHHALRLLTDQGVREVGAIYATAQDFRQYRDDIEQISQNLKLKLKTFEPQDDLGQMNRRLTPDTPAILLFVGGTPEIISFLQGIQAQRQRYIVALADVNLQTLSQLGGTHRIPIVGTQVVPVMSSSLPIVRLYKSVLAKRFDEPPTALGLAGFIAARYTYNVLSTVDGSMTRANVLAAFQKRSFMDIGGYHVSYGNSRQSNNFVAQSMLTADGRVVS